MFVITQSVKTARSAEAAGPGAAEVADCCWRIHGNCSISGRVTVLPMCLSYLAGAMTGDAGATRRRTGPGSKGGLWVWWPAVALFL